MWHTKYRANALPFDMIIDLRSVNQLDKFHYLSRKDGGNGTLLKGTVSYSMDKEHWTEAGAFEWNRKDEGESIYIHRTSRLHVTSNFL